MEQLPELTTLVSRSIAMVAEVRAAIDTLGSTEVFPEIVNLLGFGIG